MCGALGVAGPFRVVNMCTSFRGNFLILIRHLASRGAHAVEMYSAVLGELQSPHIIKGGFDLFQNCIIKRTVIISVVQQPGLLIPLNTAHCCEANPETVMFLFSHVILRLRLQYFLINTKFLGSVLEAPFNVD